MEKSAVGVMSSNSIARRLSLAAAALIAASDQTLAQTDENHDGSNWFADTSLLYYQESDDRVSVTKALANVSRDISDDVLSVGLVVDTMSGASPTGSLPSDDPAVTLTGASGDNGDLSKSSFDDQRHQATIKYQKDPDSRLTMTYGALVSQESDFDSFGADFSLGWSNVNKQQTYSLGAAFTSDTIYRSDTGGTPEPLSNNQNQRSNGKGRRQTVDVLTGYTRVLNKLTFAQLNATLSHSNGYHSDPYKVISAADENERVIANFNDSRPDARTRFSVFAQLVHRIQNTNDSLRLSYRYYRDDWGIDSQTVAVRYRHVFFKNQYIEPSLRFYTQSDADIYQRSLDVDQGQNPVLPVNGFASADYRLDKLKSTTIGLGYGVSITPSAKLRVRAEYFDQRFSTALFSKMSAVVVQTSFSYTF